MCKVTLFHQHNVIPQLLSNSHCKIYPAQMKCYSYSKTKWIPMAIEKTTQNLEEKRVPLGSWSAVKGYKLSVSDSLQLDIINR